MSNSGTYQRLILDHNGRLSFDAMCDDEHYTPASDRRGRLGIAKLLVEQKIGAARTEVTFFNEWGNRRVRRDGPVLCTILAPKPVTEEIGQTLDIRTQFGPTQSDRASVVGWLRVLSADEADDMPALILRDDLPDMMGKILVFVEDLTRALQAEKQTS
jgi:hypothetical protein